ncbi:MAG: hypothetical protein LUD52_03930 [Opitutae bacterium]|nr:hypothetical protein [Opitutae bacterium]
MRNTCLATTNSTPTTDPTFTTNPIRHKRFPAPRLTAATTNPSVAATIRDNAAGALLSRHHQPRLSA